MALTEINLYGGQSIDDLLNELYVTRRCCRHDNILDCHTTVQHITVQHQKILLSFEFSKSLDSFSLFQQGCKEELVSYIIRGTLAALDCIHASGNRVHGKINLSNVFLDKDYRVKLEFPTWSENAKEGITRFAKDNDICMVGGLARRLYRGSMSRKIPSPLPELLLDFIKLCYSPGTPTISKLMTHGFFQQFNGFDRYPEKLKELLE